MEYSDPKNATTNHDRVLMIPVVYARGRCVLSIGEIVEIGGGRLKVVSVGKKTVVLEGLPATDVVKGPRIENR